MKISVTRADIEGARRRDPNDCAVARALRRAGIVHFGVMGMLVAVEMGRQQTSLFLPGQVQEWILDFDWGLPVQPFEFELTFPPALEKQVRSRPRQARQPTLDKPRSPHHATAAANIASHLSQRVKQMLKPPGLRPGRGLARRRHGRRAACVLQA